MGAGASASVDGFVVTLDTNAHTLRAHELISRVSADRLAGHALDVRARVVSRIVLRLVVVLVAERRGLLARPSDSCSRLASLRATAALPQSASAELRECAETLEREPWLDEPTMIALSELLAGRVEQVDRSLDTLGLIHEQLLDHRPQPCAEGWILVPVALARKRSGTFYTPPSLARATVDKTLAPLLLGRSDAQLLELCVCDPAMGSAVFLLEALAHLVEARVAAGSDNSCARRRELAERCLYGVDLDPQAVELARLALWLAVGDPELACDFAAARLRHGDALIGVTDASEREHADRSCARALAIPEREPSELAREWAFFHWSIEFPERFAGPRPGFDAMLGNPPWEVRKPSAREFFRAHDPEFQGDRASALLDPELDSAWALERDQHRAFSRWIRHAFQHQGLADRNSYKLFVERAHALLREGGRLGMIVPSGVHADKGATELRGLLLDHGRWDWLFGFENHAGIFDIHRSFKFAVIVASKGGTTESLRVAFMRRDLAQWQEPEPACLAYPRARIEQFSPRTRAIVELDDPRDLELLETIYAHGVLLGDESERGWGLRYRREFDMTNDAHRFAARPSWEARGHRPDEYGHWLAGDWRALAEFGFEAREHDSRWSILERPPGLVLARDGAHGLMLDAIDEVALPVYEGRMIGQYDFSAKGWVRGRGRSARWRDIADNAKQLEPQFLMAAHEYAQRRAPGHRLGLGVMDVSASTNSRTLIAALTHDRPHGNKVPRLDLAAEHDAIELLASLNSLTVDFALRLRLVGLTLNAFILAELPVLARGSIPSELLVELLGLAAPHVAFARTWLSLRDMARVDSSRSWRSHWALTRAERVRRRVILDVVVAAGLGLDEAGLAWILRDCERPLGARPSASLHPKGFWRVDKQLPPEQRHTVLVQAAFRELRERGLAGFLAMNEGRGWLPPAALGERFEPWQLREDPASSWRECELHGAMLDAMMKLD